MKKFYDLHLSVPLDNSDLTEKMIRKAKTLGYAGLGVSFSPSVLGETLSRLRQLCKYVDIDLVTRVDLEPNSSKELLLQLRRCRRRFELISIACWHKPVARQAAKDRRVDLIYFSSLDFRRRFFDSAEAELSANALAALEIDMSPLLLTTSYERIRLLSYLRREVALAKKFSIPVILSSGVSSEFFMRGPRDLAALAYLFDVPSDVALKYLSENPLKIVTRNRTKLSSTYIAPGLRVIRTGENCVE
ncbi:MAG TPA: RNase P subunit p30 family protein [Candidatus Bathyarchaeia archaeon]|nr:RNase P subunit p30 family protein [Candidatus Bathyarchaeia archaeon]